MSPPKGGVDVLRGLKDASCCQEVSDPPADAAELTGAPLNQDRRRHGPAVCLTWFEFEDAPALGASDEFGAEERHAVQRSQGEEVPSQRSDSGNRYTPCTEFRWWTPAAFVHSLAVSAFIYVSNKSAGRR